MGVPNKGEMEGKSEQAEGRVKQAAGVLTGNEDLEAEGRADRTRGEIREGANRVKREVGEAIEDIGESMKR